MNVETKQVKLSALKLNPDNPRRIGNKEMERLVKSLQEFPDMLSIREIVVDETMTVLGGNMRLLALRKIGAKEATAKIVKGLTEAQKREFAIKDNGAWGQWDFDLLANGWDDLPLADWGVDLPEDWLVEEKTEPADAEPQIDRAEELNKVWKVKAGDLWQIGEHRLLCGDSTKAEDVGRVMGGEKADVCLTDPPYGIGDSKSEKNNYDQHDDSKENLLKIINGFLPIAQKIAPVVVLTPGNGNHRMYPPPLWTMAWFTPAGIGSGPWGFCCWQPILCYGKDPKLTKGKGRHPDAIVHTESAEKLGHPCSKPVNFWQWLTERVTESGEVIYEPFAGSGTSFVVCQNLNRKCRGIEISPAYCSVILQRMQDAFPGIEINKIK
jgi:hypothetical protein